MPKQSLPAIILIAAIIVVALAVYLFYQAWVPTPPPQATPPAPGPALPAINPLSNPLEKSPDLNPVSRANPFKGLYKNPFE